MKNLVSVFLLGSGLLLGLVSCTRYDEDVKPVGFGNRSVLQDDTFTTFMNQEVRLNVLANDQISESGNLGFRTPAHGAIRVDQKGFIYVPDHNFIGTDTFYYRFCRLNSTHCDSAKVTVMSVAPNPENHIQDMKL